MNEFRPRQSSGVCRVPLDGPVDSCTMSLPEGKFHMQIELEAERQRFAKIAKNFDELSEDYVKRWHSAEEGLQIALRDLGNAREQLAHIETDIQTGKARLVEIIDEATGTGASVEELSNRILEELAK